MKEYERLEDKKTNKNIKSRLECLLTTAAKEREISTHENKPKGNSDRRRKNCPRL